MSRSINPEASGDPIGMEPPGRRVLILMHTRDRPVLLARALSGILNQTYQDWYLSIVNDGGRSGPVDALLEEYRLAFDGRAGVRHVPASLGRRTALNTMLAATSSDFVCFHDDDDSWHPEFLSETTGFLDNPGHACFAAVMTYCTIISERIDEDGTVEESRAVDKRNAAYVDYASMLRENSYPSISQLIRRDVVQAIGGFNVELPRLADWDYNLRILKIGDVGVVPRCLAYWHHRDVGKGISDGDNLTRVTSQDVAERALYRNSMMRRMAEEDPASLGLVHVLLDEAVRNQAAMTGKLTDTHDALLKRSWDTDTWNGWRHVDLRDRLIQVESEIAEMRTALAAIRQVTDMIAQALRPARAVWRRLVSARHWMGRIGRRR